MFKYINYREYHLTNKEKLNYYLFASLSFGILGYIFYKSLVMSLIMMSLSIFFRKFYEEYKCNKRKEKLIVEFKDMLYTISSSISAGKQLPMALKECESSLEILYGKKGYLVEEIKEINRRISVSQEEENKLLEQFAKRTGLEDIENFSEICNICKTTGADLNEMIIKASSILTDKMNIEKEIKAITVQKKYESKIISFMPVMIIVFLNITSPDYMESIYGTFQGKVIMTFCIFIMIISYLSMKKLTEVKI